MYASCDLGTTAMIISISYNEQEFIRIGYYIHNTYTGELEDLTGLALEELLRNAERVVIHEKPRITKF
jgi:histone chaperone ASF1